MIAAAARHRRYAPVALAAAGCVALLSWLGLVDFAWTDYDTEASHAYLALAQGDLGGFLGQLPAYGGSLVLRAPLALLPGLWGGGELAVFRAVSLPCMAAAAILGVWLCVRLHELGLDRMTRWTALGLLACGPISLSALEVGHPEELLTATLCVVAVLAARSGRWGWAGLALGIAAAGKPWAVLAVGPVLLALPSHRLRTLLVAGLAGAALLLPIAAGSQNYLRATSTGLTSTGVIFQPWQAFWWAGEHGHIVRGGDNNVKVGYRTAPAWVDRLSHPLIVALSVPLSLLWLRRRRRRGDELLLLALLLQVRCLLDTWNTAYYCLPAIFALVVWETLDRRRPPLLALLFTVMTWATFNELQGRLGADAQSVFYLAWAVPMLGALAWMAYASSERAGFSRAAKVGSMTPLCAPSEAAMASLSSRS